ncbi:MAG: hypothetical protein AB7V16_04050 [Vulcanibacillus sp.]
MKYFKNFMLILLSIIFILLIPLTLVYESLNTTILKPYETIRYLDESGIYQEAEIVAEEEILKQLESLDIIIPSDMLGNLISRTVTEDWISHFSKEIQYLLWRYIVDESDTIGPLSLTEFNIYVKEIAKDEVNKFTGGISFLENSVNTYIDQFLPQSIDINDYFSDYTQQIEEIKKNYQLMKVLEIVIYILLAFIIVIGAILASNFKKTLRWLGIVFTITGTLTLVPALLINVIDKKKFYTEFLNHDFYQYLNSSVMTLLDLIINDIAVKLSILSVSVLIVGVFFLLFSKVFKERSSTSKSI